MTRPLLLIAALFCAGIGPASPARADATSNARQAIQAGYNKILDALQQKNGAAFLAYLTPDFKSIDVEGKPMNKPQIAHMLKQLFTEKDGPPKEQIKVQQVTLHGSTATVTQAQRDVAADGSLGSPELYRDTWVRAGKGWRIKQSRPLLSK